MVKSKKIKRRQIIKIGLPLLVICIAAAGIFTLIKYVPSVKETFILATTVKPETFTELYFEDQLSLPDKIVLHRENSFKFTIHNLENKDMNYIYEVYININGEEQLIDKNSVLIKDNEYKTFKENFTITVPTQRVKVVVNLFNRNQEIHFWMTGEE